MSASNPTAFNRRPARQTSAAETAAEYAERKLTELDRELCHRLWYATGGRVAPVKLTAMFEDCDPAWVQVALQRCLADGLLTVDSDKRVTLTATGVEAAKVGQREAVEWVRREEQRRREMVAGNRAA
jgi:hypothetical protein